MVERWVGGSRERSYMCAYELFTLMFGRNQHNSVKHSLHTPNAEGPGLILAQGTRSNMSQLRPSKAK